MTYRVSHTTARFVRYFATLAEAEWEKALQDEYWPERRAVIDVNILATFGDWEPVSRFHRHQAGRRGEAVAR